jgi:RNA polymerase sigma factor for flagellar operon FliA
VRRAVNQIQIDGLWRRYSEDANVEARGRLITAYVPLVRQIAAQLGGGLPGHVEEADLVSYGLVGLNTAIERFQPERGIRFESFAATRIRGAILDGLRALDWVPRSVRSRARAIDKARARLQHELGRRPTTAELAARLGTDEAQLREHLLEIAAGSLHALDEPWAVADASGDAVSLLEVIPDPRAPDPQAILDTSDIKVRLADAIAELPEREKLVVALYYYEGLSLKEIGEVIGVTESRVSQVHTAALGRLKEGLEAV